MNFTVAWDQEAYRELTQLWATAPDPAAVRPPARRPSGSSGPIRMGPVGTWPGLWQFTVTPLAVYYKINQAVRHVEITDVIHLA